MCGGLAYMELAWIGDALLGPSTLLNVIIVLECFRTLAAPARKSQLCSTSLATRSTLPQLQIENPNFVAHGSALPQLQLENRNFVLQVCARSTLPQLQLKNRNFAVQV